MPLNIDLEAGIKNVLAKALLGRPPYFLLLPAVVMTLLWAGLNLGSGVAVLKNVHFRWLFWLTTSASQLFLNMSQLEAFDASFFAAGSCTALVSLYVWITLTMTDRKWTLYILLFQHNLYAYRGIAGSVRLLDSYYKGIDFSPILYLLEQFLPKRIFRSIYRCILVVTKQDFQLDIVKFEQKTVDLALFSVQTLAKTAIISDLLSFFFNGFLFFMLGMFFVIFMAFRFYFRFGESFPILMMFIVFPMIVTVLTELVVSGVFMQTITYLFHLQEVNTMLEQYRKSPSKLGLFRKFVMFHVNTSVDLERNHSSKMIFMYFYLVVLSNAYLAYRMFFLGGPIFLQGLNFMLLFSSGILWFYSFGMLIYVHKQFYKHRRVVPELILKIDRKRTLNRKWKALGFYEHQTAKKMKSGFKIWPNILVNSLTFLKFFIMYCAMIVQMSNFYINNKKKHS